MRRLLVLTALLTLGVCAFGSGQAFAAAPNTQIHGPYNKTASSARFHLVALKNGTLCSRCKIQCKVDGRAWKLCVTGGGQGYWTFRSLSRGYHVARARAIDRAGRRDRTPAVKGFTL